MGKTEGVSSNTKTPSPKASSPAPVKKDTNKPKSPQFSYNAALDTFTQEDPDAWANAKKASSALFDQLDQLFGVSSSSDKSNR